MGRIQTGVRALAACVGVALVLAAGGCFHSHVELNDDDAEASAGTDGEVEADAVNEGDADVYADGVPDAAVDDAPAESDGATCSGWFDPTSGLCWQDPAPSTAMDLSAAVEYCDTLSLSGYGPGSWHLPTIDELRSLIRGCPATEPGGACAVTDPSCLDDNICMNEWCDGCSGMWGCHWPDPVSGICSVYLSSSRHADRFGVCDFVVRFTSGSLGCGGDAHVRCVRSGP